MTSPNSIKPLQFTKYTPTRERKDQNSNIVLSPRPQKLLSQIIDAPTNSAIETQAPKRPVPPTPIRARRLSFTEVAAVDADNTAESTSDKTGTSEDIKGEFSASPNFIRETREEEGPNVASKPLESAIARARRSLKSPSQLISPQPRGGIPRNQTSDDQQHSFPMYRIELNSAYGANDSASSSPEKQRRGTAQPKRNAFASTKNTPKKLNLKREAGKPNLDPFESLSNSAEVSKLTNRLTKLGEPLPAREPSPTKRKIADTLLSPRAAIKGAIEAKAAAKIEAKRAKQIKIMLAHLPAGVVLDDNGNLSGKGYLTHVPFGMMDAAPEHYGMPFDTFANIKLATLLKSKVIPVFDENKPDELNTSQETTRQAMHDMWRHDIELIHEDGSIFKVPDSNKNDRDRTVLLLNSLRELARSDSATTVLTAMLTQSLPTLFYIGLASPDGNALKSLRLLHSKNSFKVKKTLTKHDGSTQLIEQVHGLGATKFQIWRDEGKFYVSADLTAYYDATPSANEILPLGENEVISVRAKATFIVDAAAAEAGNLLFSIPQGIETTFEGCLRIN